MTRPTPAHARVLAALERKPLLVPGRADVVAACIRAGWVTTTCGPPKRNGGHWTEHHLTEAGRAALPGPTRGRA